MNISTSFAPPFKLIAPYFIVGYFVLFICSVLLFAFDVVNLHVLEPKVIGFTHFFLLGFVMMVILGAMAQLIPVVLEVGHFSIDFYYIIFPFHLMGSILIFIGFYFYPFLIPIGGFLVFFALSIFVIENFLTIKKVKKMNFVMFSVLCANIALLVGIVLGVILSLGYTGILIVNLDEILKSHIFFVLFGFMGITIFGISMVLLPMFWLSHDFSWKNIKIGLAFLLSSLGFVLISSFFSNIYFEYLAYFLAYISFIFYFIQIYIVYKTKARVEKDIYTKSMIVSYICLVLSLVIIPFIFISSSMQLILLVSWLVFFGFFNFLIIGHLYKIIPFLVWFERFSPYVGKRPVPMLVDLIPVKSSNFQFIFNTLAIGFVALGICIQNDFVYKSGLSFLCVGTLFLIKDMFYMINFKDDKNV
ncbi:MAG: hypothetical protein KGV43_01155 [Arcobacter sp.]|nr:hypothetical protein [Arcobacter sp.]